MKHLTVWTASEHTKLFGMLNEPFFIGKIARFTGRSTNEVLTKLLNIGLCDFSSKTNTVTAARYTNMLCMNGYIAFLPKLLSLGWEHALIGKEEALKAPEWWLKSAKFPQSAHGKKINRNGSIWINDEIRTVISMMKEAKLFTEICLSLARNEIEVADMLVDIGILAFSDNKPIYLTEINPHKQAKYSFNDALVLIDNGWSIKNQNLTAPDWWVSLAKEPDAAPEPVKTEEKNKTNNRELYGFVKNSMSSFLSLIKENGELVYLNNSSIDEFEVKEIAEYVGIIVISDNSCEKVARIKLSQFFKKPYNTKKELIKYGWLVDGDHLNAPTWWLYE
ncbi:hypothetical protein KKJ01_18165 [Xenorhabdus bovienii]|uniref:Uncharacterized protein n=1 Tax=Xenorhabdus bovienii TaxID=40576 RepID=A0AAJ1JA94_XENBV|nr:hypothetical protein [Xenorhabdus bovienii]MDE1480092.1 hypothetical protein [Xenorhabdus bovienii]MDE9511788.1 hypothetical protein [Xenorhabdus bovienii]MDE9523439.1 hypothetical protein [Xenorhabdus bovienii]